MQEAPLSSLFPIFPRPVKKTKSSNLKFDNLTATLNCHCLSLSVLPHWRLGHAWHCDCKLDNADFTAVIGCLGVGFNEKALIHCPLPATTGSRIAGHQCWPLSQQPK